MGVSDISLSLPCNSGAPGIARAAMAELSGIEAVRDDAVLVASELVANAVLHSGGSAEDTIVFRAHCHPDYLKICVRDAGRSAAAPRVRSDGPRGHGGFGLVLVDSLSRRWDTHEDGGRVVWAEMDLEPAVESLVS